MPVRAGRAERLHADPGRATFWCGHLQRTPTSLEEVGLVQPRCSTRTGVGQGGGGSGPSSGHMTLVPPSGRGEGRECGVGVTRAWGSLSRGRGGSWPGSEAGPSATTLWNPGPRGQSRRAGRLLTGWHNLSVPRVRGARTLLGKGPAPPGSHPASLPPRFPFPRSRVPGWGSEPLGPGSRAWIVAPPPGGGQRGPQCPPPPSSHRQQPCH